MSPKSAILDFKNSIRSMRASAKTAHSINSMRASTKTARQTKKRGLSARATLKALLKSPAKRPKLTEDDLINAESRLGGTLFGPVPDGHRREFFRYKHNVWVYHEAWRDQFGHQLETTITYEVRENGVYKQPLGGKYVKITGGELDNFVKATKEYLKLIKSKLY